MLGIAVDHMAHGGQHRRGDGHTPPLSPGAAFAASELTFQKEEPGVLRFRRAAHKAPFQHGLIADETHEFQFKGGFDEGRRTGELGQGIECVEDMGEHRLGGDVFLTDGLHHLGKIGPQRQLIHVLPHPPEELQRFGGVEGIAVLVGKEGQFRVDQQLRPRRQRASLPAAPSGSDGLLAAVGGEDGEDLVALLIAHFPQDQTFCHTEHSFSSFSESILSRWGTTLRWYPRGCSSLRPAGFHFLSSKKVDKESFHKCRRCAMPAMLQGARWPRKVPASPVHPS